MHEKQGIIGNRTPIVERGESIMKLTAEALKAHLANPVGNLNVIGLTALSRVHAVPSQQMIERRVPAATAHRTPDVTAVVPEISLPRRHQTKHKPCRFLRRILP